MNLSERFIGAIAFSSKQDSFISKAIRKFTNSMWSHTFVVWRDVDGEWLCIEANDFELAISPLKKFFDKSYNVVFFEPDVGIDRRIFAIKRVLSLDDKRIRIGATYGYLQLIGFAIVLLLRKLGIRRRSNIFTQGVICSEFVAWYLSMIGLAQDLFLDKSLDLISPEDIYNHVLLNANRFVYLGEKKFGRDTID